MGVELARLGVPVVASTSGIGPFPSDHFIETAPTKDEYIALIDGVLARPPSLDTAVLAYRWYWMFVLGATVDLSDVLTPNGEAPAGTAYQMPIQAVALCDSVFGTTDPLTLNLQAQIAKQVRGVAEQERVAVRAQLARITAYLLSGRDPGTIDAPVPRGAEAYGLGGPHVLTRVGSAIRYTDGTKSFEGSSRMLRRLMTLVTEAAAFTTETNPPRSN